MSINKQVDYDLKDLANWKKVNKISLNVGKTENVLSTSLKKQLDCDLKIKLNWKRLYETDSGKYFGIQIDKSITWKQQINYVALKLSKANVMLSKSRLALDIKTLTLLYYAIFESHLGYAALVWEQKTDSANRFHLLQEMLLRIMFF